MLRQGTRLGLDSEAPYGHYFEVLRAARWSPKLATFAWKLIAGVLPMGKALGCKQAPEYDTVTGES
jgi:hypothetical protein